MRGDIGIMNFGELVTIKVADDNLKGEHTRYSEEIRLLSCVQRGDIDQLIKEYKNINMSIIAGKLSHDNVTQFKYFAVSAMTLVTRYAIQGGLNEKTAYELSDNAIMQIDTFDSESKIVDCLVREIINITKMVAVSKTKPTQSPHVRKCICFVNENLSNKITVATLSEYCGISADYLSQIFKEEMGENLSSYITRKKLDVAKNMIMQGKSMGEICQSLGFSSKSYFATAFKKHYNMTPTEYANLTK